MTTLPRRGLQRYAFGDRAPIKDVTEQSINARSQNVFFDQSPREIIRKSNGVALPRLAKGAVQHEMIVSWLYQQQRQRMWISDNESSDEGAFMRETWSEFITAPAAISQSGLADALVNLNAEIIITMKSTVVETFFRLKNETGRVMLRSGLQIQMIPSIRDLKLAQKHQCAAFVQDESMILIWADDPNEIIQRAVDLENQLVEISWQTATGVYPKSSSRRRSNVTAKEHSLECGTKEERPPIYINSVICAITLAANLSMIGLGIKELVRETRIDHTYRRWAVLAFVPVQFFLSLFFIQIIVICLFQLIGPIGQYQANTKYYSGKAPVRIKRKECLPHVTIQCPIYTENLDTVVEPTILSLKDAIATYEMQGGSANIFVNDDGLLAGLSKLDVEARKRFYKTHNIGWVARPAHNPAPTDGSKKFLRRGRFKKASNMNYALMVSTKVEAKLARVTRDEYWAQEDEEVEYERCLTETLHEINPITLVGGNIRIVDSDTRIPVDCLLDAVSEMEESPDVAILQYIAGVLHVSDDFFERGISYFTNLIYTAIGYMVSNGDMAAFVGHNSIIRWEALQDITFEEDDVVKFWSESSVSEDFDMALRLQFKNWVIRFASYTHEGFKEGVSLTIYDEISRWEKYAYGCSEMIFHPLKDWPRRGPFTKLIHQFIWSSTSIASKTTTLAYIASYYAIGMSWTLTVVNYFLVGWAGDWVDTWYLQSFDSFIGLLFIFSFICNVALALLRYRTSQKGFFSGLFENFKWVILFSIMFGGLSFSISRALLCHLFSVDISWSTTSKEVESSNFFQEVPKIIKQFKYRFMYCAAGLATILVCSFAVPYQWRIREFVAIFPLAVSLGTHFLLPIALNPSLMKFTW